MAISTPSDRIVADAPRRGRPSDEDREARTSTGRWLHRQEDALFTLNAICAASRERRLHWQRFDAMADDAIRDTESIGRALVQHPDPLVRGFGFRIVANCQAYWQADAAEDAEVGLKDRAIDLSHAIGRKVCGWIERAAVAVRGRS